MQVIVTAVGPDNTGLVAPLVQTISAVGTNIAEIQMYDHDNERLFAMLMRASWPDHEGGLVDLRQALVAIGRTKGLSVRVWSPRPRPRLAICVTRQKQCPQTLLSAIADGSLRADAAVLIGNRPHLKALADEHGIPWHNIANDDGVPDNDVFVNLLDEYDVDYVVLARYMRILPASICWKYAGGRIINLHHGLLPGFPGARPYHDAHARRMLTYGATAHFIIPELDAGDQTIHQDTFTVNPGTTLKQIIKRGREDNEHRVLLEGVRRVVDGEVALRFHKVVATR